MRIDLDGLTDIPTSGMKAAQGLLDLAGMKEQRSVARAQTQSLVHVALGLHVPGLGVKGPCESVGGVDAGAA